MSEEKRIWPCVCVDLESLDTRPGGRILEIGAVCFDPMTGELGPEFSMEIDPLCIDQEQRTVDLETVMWWMGQQAKGIVMPGWNSQQSRELWHGLNELTNFFCENTPMRDGVSDAEVWAWGSDFDFPMLKSAYDQERQAFPWRYRNQRDARTFCEMLGVKREGDVLHRALRDAGHEAIAVMSAFRKVQRCSHDESEAPRWNQEAPHLVISSPEGLKREFYRGGSERVVEMDFQELLDYFKLLLKLRDGEDSFRRKSDLEETFKGNILQVLGILEKRISSLPVSKSDLDYEAGWNAYRQELLETMGRTHLPLWKDCPEQLRECWCVGVQAAFAGKA